MRDEHPAKPKPERPASDLDALLARVTAENLHGEIETGPSVGAEAW